MQNTENTMTLDTAKNLITGFQAEAATKAAEAAAKLAAEKAAHEAELAKNDQLSVACGVQKFFKRKRTGRDGIGDALDHYEFIRLDERSKGGTGWKTKGISSIDGIKDQVYTLSTLLTLELSSPSEFLAEKAKIDAAAAE